MNFEIMEQLISEQRAAVQENLDTREALKSAKESAEAELETIDKNSRTAFAIKGELEQLKNAIAANEIEYRQIIESRANEMMMHLEKNRVDLIAQNDAALKEKYALEVVKAMDRLVELKEGYLSDEAEFMNKLRDDIRGFRIYDNKKYPDVSSLMMSLHSFGYAYVFNNQLDRLYK